MYIKSILKYSISIKILSVFLLLFFFFYINFKIYASDLEFSEDAIANREDIIETDKYKIEDSLIEEYGVDDIFTDKESSMEGEYTTEGLFEGKSQEVSLVNGEFDDLFTENKSYHEIYESESSSNLMYKILLMICVIIISYFLTQIYILLRTRRKNAKNKNRV